MVERWKILAATGIQWERLHRALHYYALRRVGNRMVDAHTAADLVADTFTALFEKTDEELGWDSGRESLQDFLPRYLAGILRHKVTDRFRRSKKIISLDQVACLIMPPSDRDTQIVAQEMELTLRRSFKGKRTARKEALTVFRQLIVGKNYQEISVGTNLNIERVYAVMKKIRKAVRPPEGIA